MYSVTVREHVMIARSIKGEAFGPAQKLHGATYVLMSVLLDLSWTKTTSSSI